MPKKSRKKSAITKHKNVMAKAQGLKISKVLQQAQQYQQAQEWQKAEALYHQVLQKQPKNKSALNFYRQLGSAFSKRRQFAEAITYFQRALSFNPNHAEMQNDLGIIFGQQGKLEQAKACFEKAIAEKKDFAQAYYNLGIILNGEEQFAEAITCYQKALSITPHYADAYNNLGNSLSGQDKISEAIINYQKAITLNPNYAEAHNNLGVAFKKEGQIVEAVASFQQAIALNPNYLDAYNNLGVTFNDQEQFKDAETCFKAVLSLNPNDVEAHISLAHLLHKQIKLTETIACYQRALALEPHNVLAHGGLGNTLKEKGLINEAIVHYKKALALKATDCKVHYNLIHSNLVFTLNYSPQYDRAALFLEHQRFNEQHAVPLSASIKQHLNNNNPHRKLKIGYVSADLKNHSVAFFMKPILAHHNHEQFEIVCYYNHTQVDHITEQLQQYSDYWVPCVELSDEALADKIREDQIDILVDLSGHIAGNRLLTFARKPAPIQATYIGYPNTTGLTVIDYHITDNYVDPEGIAEAFHSEIPMRMPASYYCFDPLIERTAVNECPALKNGYITFCCFNNYAKLNRETFVLWAKILQSLPDAKLVIMNASLQDLETQQSLEKTFANLGIKSTRLEIGYISSTEKTFSTYNQIDIALDSYPYNGATTTCQALWMGVPVVTLVGETHVARAGLSILSAVSLTELIASSPEEYIDICVKLANNTQYLQKMRTEMRDKIQASPLMDGASFTRHLESEYRKMWEKWCDK